MNIPSPASLLIDRFYRLRTGTIIKVVLLMAIWMIVLIVALRPTSSKAAAPMNCSELHLDREPGSLSDSPVKDQGPLPDCTFMSSSDLGNAYLKSHGVSNFQIDPLILSAEERLAREKPKGSAADLFLNAGGNTSSVLKFMKNHEV